MQTLRTLTLIITTAAIAFSASAHELWLKPAVHSVHHNELLMVSIKIGHRFEGDTLARNTPMINRYALVSPDHDPVPVTGAHMTKEGYLRPTHAGVIVYHTKHYRSNLPPEKFASYLREEGKDEIVRIRAERGESDMEGREVYSRCAKSVITLKDGSSNPAEIDHDTGLPLEITLENMESTNGKRTMHASIEFNDQPISDLRVVAVHRSNPNNPIVLNTDESGMIQFECQPGDWMLTTLHIHRTDSVADAEWESYFASSTFAVPD